MADGIARSEEKSLTMGFRPLVIAVLLALASLFALGATSASAYVPVEPGFETFTVAPSNTQAGGHPDVTLEYEYRRDEPNECEINCLFARRFQVHWPEGFIGNPHVAPKCTSTEYMLGTCPVDSQIGIFMTRLGNGRIFTPLYNMQTRPNQAGMLQFTAPLLSFPVRLELSGRTDSDYGLDAISSDLIRLPMNHYGMELWGVPADPANNPKRFMTPLTGAGSCQALPGQPISCALTSAKSTVPPAPFLQSPTTCATEGLVVTGKVIYYGGKEGNATSPWPSTTGCNQASFTPSVIAKPTSSSADTAAGLDARLEVPQTQSPITPSPSQLKAVRMTLPKGFSINPAVADGKAICPELLTGIGTLGPASCPEFSKIGTSTIDVSALPGPIPGALYLLESKPDQRYRVLLTASGYATHIKLIGNIEADPIDGQLRFQFEDLPQSPLQSFDLHVFGSERGVFVTPRRCGTFVVETEFVPWNSALATRISHSTIAVDAGSGGTPCPAGALPFAPKVDAGVTNSTAADHAPFVLSLSRGDRDQWMTGLRVTTPPGFAASLRGIPYCPEAAVAKLSDPAHTAAAEAASSACPAASQVGNAAATAGVGSRPLNTQGKVYLAGPYKGAPLSLVVAIAAVSGPYDLGNIAVRAAVHVDNRTARVTAISDPIPQIKEGVPLRTRSILINLDRPGFALNPTNCNPLAVDTWLDGDEGASSASSTHFQATNCADLGFAPKLGIRLSGSVKRRGNPAIRATFRPEGVEANIRTASVTLPKGSLLDNSHLDTICSRVDFAANRCPEGSRIGTAVATTRILDQPLVGNVYLRSSSNQLPDMVVDLRGQFTVELSARIDSVKGRLRTTFANLPDIPIESFVLGLEGGRKGLLVNSGPLCKEPQRAVIRMVGQNGVRLRSQSRLQTACPKESGKASRHSTSRLMRAKAAR